MFVVTAGISLPPCCKASGLSLVAAKKTGTLFDAGLMFVLFDSRRIVGLDGVFVPPKPHT